MKHTPTSKAVFRCFLLVGTAASFLVGIRTATAQSLVRASDPPPPLIGPSGIAPDAVRQGELGSCYFYASLAAIANSSPDQLRSSLVDLGAGKYRVTFKDGKSESVSLEDVMYARKNGFDHSDGLWVPILFRAFAQSALRQALVASVEASSLPFFAKSAAELYILQNDALLLAYDRAVREQVYQSGQFDRGRLKVDVDQQMAAVGVPVDIRKQLAGFLYDKGFLDTMAQQLEANGELFGAYRAAGSGGLPERVIQAYDGDSENIPVTGATDQLKAELSRMSAGKIPAIATSRPTLPHDLLYRIRTDPAHPDWWVPFHAYTVLEYDSQAATVKLRNPWGKHPEPDGTFTISLDDFVAVYSDLAIASK